VDADLRDPESILEHADTRDLIDFNEPVAILLSAILHFIPDEDDPYGLVARLMKPLVPGSYLALTHAGSREITPRAHEAAGEYRSATAQITLRQQSDIARFFVGLDLVDPGVAPITEWHNPAPPSGDVADDLEGAGYVGVGRKP
jgi:trans-aconitate methyltransferase